MRNNQIILEDIFNAMSKIYCGVAVDSPDSRKVHQITIGEKKLEKNAYIILDTKDANPQLYLSFSMPNGEVEDSFAQVSSVSKFQKDSGEGEFYVSFSESHEGLSSVLHIQNEDTDWHKLELSTMLMRFLSDARKES